MRKAIALVLTLLATPALAATMTVNGSSGSTSAGAGTVMSVAVSGGPANPKDWVGLYPQSGNNNLIDWVYLASDLKTVPAAGVSSGTVHLTAPTALGHYIVRYFASTSSAALASISVSVVPAPMVWTGQGATWLPQLDITGIPFLTFPQASTIRSITCRIEVPVGAGATFIVVKARDGQKISEGMTISAACDGNTALLSTKQDLTLANPIAVNPGDTIGFSSTSGTWAKGNGIGSVTVGYTVP